MTTRYAIGLDYGTSATKVLAVDVDGHTIGAEQVPTVSVAIDGRSFHEPTQVWDSVAGCIRRLVSAVQPAQPVALGVAGVGEEGVPVDKTGAPLAPALVWHDTCTEGDLSTILARFDAQYLYDVTGLPPAPHFTLAKWLWLMRHDPQILRRASTWLSTPDYIAFRLTGSRSMAETEACRTMAYDIRRRSWRPDLLRELGLPTDFLPAIGIGSQTSGVCERASRETGLPEGLPVLSAGHDHIVAAAAVGGTKPGRLVDSCGSAEALVLPLASPRLGPDGLRARVEIGRYVIDGLFYASLAVPAGRLMAWAHQLLTPWPEEDARNAPPGSNGTSVDIDTASLHTSITGLRPATSRGEVARAFVEGLTREYACALKRLTAAVGQKQPHEVIVVGGLSRSELWLEVKSAMTGQRLLIPPEADATAAGAALLAGDSIGFTRLTDHVDRALKCGRQVTPDQGAAREYQRLALGTHPTPSPADNQTASVYPAHARSA